MTKKNDLFLFYYSKETLEESQDSGCGSGNDTQVKENVYLQLGKNATILRIYFRGGRSQSHFFVQGGWLDNGSYPLIVNAQSVQDGGDTTV